MFVQQTGGHLGYWMHRLRDHHRQTAISGQLGSGSTAQNHIEFGRIARVPIRGVEEKPTIHQFQSKPF